MNKKERILIFAGGSPPAKFDRNLLQGDIYVICADSGLLACESLGIKPNLVLGDFDSLDSRHVEALKMEKVKILQFPPEKDKSDLQIALETACDMNSEEIIILGAMGGRTDHHLINISLLFNEACFRKNIRIIGENEELFAAKNRARVNGLKGSLVSLIPFSNVVKNVRTYGFYYPLEGEDLFMGSSRSLSNILTDVEGIVEHDKGNLLVIIRTSP